MPVIGSSTSLPALPSLAGLCLTLSLSLLWVSVLQVGPRENPYYQEILEHLHKIQRGGKALSHLVLVSRAVAQQRNLLHGRERLQQVFTVSEKGSCAQALQKQLSKVPSACVCFPCLQHKLTALSPVHHWQQ